MKKKLTVILLIAGVLVLAYLYAHIDKNTYLYDRNTDSADLTGTGILEEKEEILQSFTCTEDSVDGINLKATVIGSPENAELQYALIDPESGEALRQGKIQGLEIENNKFNKLKFPVLKETKGKSYILRLTESGTGEEAGIGFFLSPRGEQGQELRVRGNETRGTLAVRILTHRFDLETFIVLLGIIAFIAGFMKVLYKLFK